MTSYFAQSPPHLLHSPENLDNFIQVYGNKYKRVHFLALRFKRAILTYKASRSLDPVPLEPSPNSVLVVRGQCPPVHFRHPSSSFLLFSVDSLSSSSPPLLGSIPAANHSEESLLRALFPNDKILFAYFKSNVLFLIASDNPFANILKPCRKDQAFKTLYSLWEIRTHNRPLTLSDVSRLRFFRRNAGGHELHRFTAWASLAFKLCKQSCVKLTCCEPSAYLGKELSLILKRSETAASLHQLVLPPPEFYQCELLCTGPVGVAFSVTNDMRLDYVSPMVVSKPACAFRDTCSKVCNAWLPFYKNRDTWQRFGMAEYVSCFYVNKRYLNSILAWLKQQTAEKYRFIDADLRRVAHVLFGTEESNKKTRKPFSLE